MTDKNVEFYVESYQKTLQLKWTHIHKVSLASQNVLSLNNVLET